MANTARTTSESHPQQRTYSSNKASISRLQKILESLKNATKSSTSIESLDRPVFALGNTGSGKSTLLNYLAGCDMEEVAGNTRGTIGKIIDVKSDSKIPPVTKIGHTKSSETFTPIHIKIENLDFFDCPGFLDTRGLDYRLVNIMSMLKVIDKSIHPLFIIVFDYTTLMVSRAKSLEKLAKSVCYLFGTSQHVEERIKSIYFFINQVSAKDQDDEPLTIEEFVQDICSQEDTLSSEVRKIRDLLFSRACIFDPVERFETRYISGGINRLQILHKIRGLESPLKVEHEFSACLDTADKQELGMLGIQLVEEIARLMADQNDIEAAKLLRISGKLEMIRHASITQIRSDSIATVVRGFDALISEIHDQSLKVDRDPEWTQNTVEKIEQKLSIFHHKDRPFLETEIDLCKLRTSYHSTQKRRDANYAVKQIEFLVQTLERNFNLLQPGIEDVQIRHVVFVLATAKKILQQVRSEVVSPAIMLSAIDIRNKAKNLQVRSIEVFRSGVRSAVDLLENLESQQRESRERQDEINKAQRDANHQAELLKRKLERQEKDIKRKEDEVNRLKK